MRKLVIDGKISNCYVVSEMGEIFNVEGKRLTEFVSDAGYARVRLCRDIKRGMYSVHRIVACTFIENPNSYPIVNHKDNDRLNNRCDNLEWCDNSMNQKQRYVTYKGTKRKPVCQYTLDGDFIKRWESPIDVFRCLGVQSQNISKVCRGKRKQAGGFVWKYEI